jgi:hypothetical protein
MWITQRRKVDKAHCAMELVGYPLEEREREVGFADPAGAGECEQLYIWAQNSSLECLELALTTDQASASRRCGNGRRDGNPLTLGCPPRDPDGGSLGFVQSQRGTDGFDSVTVRPCPTALEIADRLGRERRLGLGRQLFLAQTSTFAMAPQQLSERGHRHVLPRQQAPRVSRVRPGLNELFVQDFELSMGGTPGRRETRLNLCWE